MNVQQIPVKKAVPYLRVSDLAAELRFYQEVLGFEIRQFLRQGDGEIFWAQLQNGDTSVMLSSRPVHDRSRLTWLYVEDVDAIYASLRAQGVEPLSEPKNESHQNREFLIETPDGTVYVIAQSLHSAPES